MNAHDHRPPAAAILVVPLVVALVLTLFAWPSSRLEPRDLPIGVAGAPAAVEPLERQLEAQEGAFDLHRYATEAEARDAIEQRQVYGAFVAGPSGAKVLTSSAGSPAVAQLLTHAGAEQDAEVEDVVTTPPAGSGLGSSVLPLVLAGILTGVLAALAVSRGSARAGLTVAGSVLAGLSAALIADTWLGIVEGDWLVNAGAFALTFLAIAGAMVGLHSLFGKAGLGIGALIMIFIGNPFSAAATAPELLPEPVGGLGQLLPPGAGANLLRSTGFFDGAGAGEHIAVLAVWAVLGLAAALVTRSAHGTLMRPVSSSAWCGCS
jgi:hypothetical protein